MMQSTLNAMQSTLSNAEFRLGNIHGAILEQTKTNKELVLLVKGLINILGSKKGGNVAKDGLSTRAKNPINTWSEMNKIYQDVPSGSDAKDYYLNKAKEFARNNHESYNHLNVEAVKKQIVAHKNATKKRTSKARAGVVGDENEGIEDGEAGDDSNNGEDDEDDEAGEDEEAGEDDDEDSDPEPSRKRQRRDEESERVEERARLDIVLKEIVRICGKSPEKAAKEKRMQALRQLARQSWTHLREEVKKMTILLTITDTVENAKEVERRRSKGKAKRTEKEKIASLMKLEKAMLIEMSRSLGLDVNQNTNKAALSARLLKEFQRN